MTAAHEISPRPALPERIAGRYRVESELGRGGMAVAYLVEDEQEHRPLALKRLLANEGRPDPKLMQFFEHEYRALKQLSHPRVVAVHSFGWDDDQLPFYTMEWLGGGDLQTLSPLPAERVCALLSDVSSALALLHSRGFVHRDVTPRNVRCTEDGLAKLIDFGGVVQFGPSSQVVGTPAFCPPEALRGLHLDGRTDLFALGCTAYFALTGRYPYPARTFATLDALWQQPIAPPSHHAAGVPPELDALVLELLALDRDARPRTAVEVMERLRAIGKVEFREELVVQQAYLSTPRLQGREAALHELRRLLRRVGRRRTRVLQVVGDLGTGRSRFLDHCALEGQLQGMAVARADASDATQEFGVAKAIVSQLGNFEQGTHGAEQPPHGTNPPLTWRARADGTEAEEVDAQSLMDRVLRASTVRPLLLVIDDADRIDERSAALLSLLAAGQSGSRIVLVASLSTHAAEDAVQRSLQVFRERATVVELQPLSLQDTRALLASIFGEPAHLDLLADRLHHATDGMPGAIMQVAQHLLDRGTIRFELGTFVLPAELQAGDLPRGLLDTLRARFDALSPAAQRLVQGLALIERAGLTRDELRRLLASETDDVAQDAIDELLAQRFLSFRDGKHQLANETYRRSLTGALTEAELRELHRLLAAIYQDREERSWSFVQHLILAGDHEAALQWLLPTARDHTKLTPDEVAVSTCHLPQQWPLYLREVLSFCERTQRPRADAHYIRNTLVAYSAMTAHPCKAELAALLAQLEQDCGVDLYRKLPSSMPANERLMASLSAAQERFDSTPEADRICPPGEALPWLAKAVVQAIGVMGARYDFAFFRELTCMEHFVPLSPALQIVQWNVEGTRAIASGHHHVALERIGTMLDRMAEPDGGGLDALLQRFMGLALRYSYAMFALMFGRDVDEQHLADMEADPLFTINARLIRMVGALGQGDTDRADQLKQEAELIRLRDNPPQMFAGAYVHREYTVYAFAGDLARLKHVLPQIKARADEMPGWVPIHHHAQAAYHRLRGAPEEALKDLRAGLEGLRVGEHPTFVSLAADLVSTLVTLGRHEEALATGEQHLRDARAAELGPSMHQLLEALALAHAESGHFDRAQELADEVVSTLEAFRAGKLVLGSAYETRARVALASGDGDVFERYSSRCEEIYRAGHNPLLTARYNRLVQLAARTAHTGTTQSEANTSWMSTMSTLNAQLLSDYADGPERAREALAALLRQAGATDGFLYLIQDGEPQLKAQAGALLPPADLDSLVEQLLAPLCGDDDDLTQTGTLAMDGEAEEPSGWSNPDGELFSPVLLSHGAPSGRELTGVLVVGPGGRGLPPQLLSGVSQALRRSGDVTPVQWD